MIYYAVKDLTTGQFWRGGRSWGEKPKLWSVPRYPADHVHYMLTSKWMDRYKGHDIRVVNMEVKEA